jgi:N-acetylglucosaminyl-diphospho-decaprenol L-rhamnosyltransferase
MAELKAQPPGAPIVSAIVVSFNTRQMTLDCLRSLQTDLTGIASEIIVVDNASTDASAAAIHEMCPDVKLIENAANRGFGAANNQAMRVAEGEFFLLLNSDAFPKPGAIAALLSFMQDHPQAGVVGPHLLHADGTTQRSCFRFPSPGRAWLENLWISSILPHDWAWGDWRRWPHDQEQTVEFVIGACMLVRRQAFEQTGGFDEDFFMYSEEADWQKRIHDAGWRILFTPAAQVVHLGGASGASQPAQINRYFFDSLDHYELKHHGRIGLALLHVAMIVGCALRAPAWALLAILPSQRQRAWDKLKLRLWLIWRQATDWSALRRDAVAFAGSTSPTERK